MKNGEKIIKDNIIITKLGNIFSIRNKILNEVVLFNRDELGNLHSMIDTVLMESSKGFDDYVDSFNAIDETVAEGKAEDYE